MKRLFFSVSIHDLYKKELVHSFPQKNYHGIRWTKEEQLHITLHFLGPVEEEKVQELISHAAAVSKSFHSFNLQFNTFKAILHNRKPTMIWAQFEENQTFELLTNKFREVFPTGKNRKPVPHATLARIKQLRSLPFELPIMKSFSFLVDEMHLWESHLNSSGSVYSSVTSFRLSNIMT